MGHEQAYPKLLSSLYAAAADPHLWSGFLHELLESTNAYTGMVLAFDDTQRPVLAAQLGVDEATQRSYREHFFETDIIRERISAAAPAEGPWVCLRQELIDDRELERNSFYNEYMRPQNMFHQVGTTIGDTPGFSVGGLSLLRSKHKGIFEDDTVNLLSFIAPHMRNAFLLDRKLRRLELQERTLGTVAGAVELAFVAVDSNRRVILQNQAAERILAQASCVSLSGKMLRLAHAADDNRLQHLIAGAAGVAFERAGAALTNAIAGTMSVSRGPGKMPLQVTVTPMIAERRSPFRPDMERAVLVFLTIPDAELKPRGEVLRLIFGLSPSEARLANCMLTGISVREASEMLRLTESSGRFMLKSIFKKTGVKSQSALMRLMLVLRA